MIAPILFSILLVQTDRSYTSDNPYYYFDNGNSAYEQNKFENAILQYNIASNLDSTFFAARLARGKAYSAIGKYDDAMVDFDECISLNSENKNTYIQRGILKASMSEYGAALMDFEQYRELDPFDSEISLYVEYCKLLLHGF